MRLTQAILPVAGLGTRFLPWTKVIPKELLPLRNRPMIAFLVDECLGNGITDICFVISHGKELIPQYFTKDLALEALLAKRGKVDALQELCRYAEVRFTTIYQEEQLGDGHAVLQAQTWVQSTPVAVLFGDDLIVGKATGLQQLMSAYTGLPEDSILLCLEDVPREYVRKYGIVGIDERATQGRLKKVTHLIEKPSPEEAPSTFGIVGKYIIPRSTFSALTRIVEEMGGPAGKEIRLVDAFLQQLPTTQIYGYAVEGKRIDTGTPEGYREAVRIMG
ncbi:hypothetical protein A3H22_03940 [Candidatus Peribacteria bacterium RIFCSPLOWO2_12_FULL_55_15]|nr:MAG: hypothetical protein A2789_03935 [Candidatus Peribacteria bacterium RIFCSPHIGHO2_01_FULL_54_22]OGJ62373.1 MAG: hypothetical protein A3D12_01980 [Candidatus Peribacteria bacterium RIFCSPHIGHO2_02_FULL_55_24]OGJ65237.1 MAG: hypothetical protein A3E47_01415 [Candidatus Peribacteria bacterium RIFCSPHIGHO2_12_FULL_54_10]OGJ68518.1 MAG: hypothetical protein A2947_02055 [Candidatus Peribacteria bacterium RIFCSPLOWO2_01_FULL_54_110]OGJ69088.1 MAG: hypothetical protein A3H90_02300 [Candidatus Pe